MTEQRELVFHDTVPIETELLEKHRKKAVRQKDQVLAFFRVYHPRNFTPSEMYELMRDSGHCVLITSIRRCITDLTKEGKLYKCMWSESRKGAYDTLNRTWKFNPDWMPRLNPQK
jgi:hypothetical protein